MLDHIIFHIEIAPLHCKAAVADTNNSGAEVPIANIVNQIKTSETLKCLAILTHTLIRWSAENTKKNNPANNTIIAATITRI